MMSMTTIHKTRQKFRKVPKGIKVITNRTKKKQQTLKHSQQFDKKFSLKNEPCYCVMCHVLKIESVLCTHGINAI